MPIVSLPLLRNDTYKIIVEGQVVVVLSVRHDKEILRLDKKHLRIPDNADKDMKIVPLFYEIGSGTEELDFDWIIEPGQLEPEKAEQDGAGQAPTAPESK